MWRPAMSLHHTDPEQIQMREVRIFLRRADNKRQGAGRWSRITPHSASRVYAVACALSLCAGATLAQHPSTHSLLRGMVVGPTRVPLAAVLVTAMDTANKAVFTGHTDSVGAFALQGLSSGVLYLITVSKPGFVALGTRATLRPADTLDLDVMLANDTMTAWSPPSASPRIRGTVVDSMRTPLAAAVVTAVDSATNKTVFEVRTDSAGRFTFDRLAAGVPYLITARRIGSIEDTSRATLHPGDTLNVPFVLAPISVLTPVRVIARADLEYHNIGAAEIAKERDHWPPINSAEAVLLQLRPLMLGNPYKGCMTAITGSLFRFAPDSMSLWVMQDPRKYTFGVGSWALSLFKNGGVQMYRKHADSTSVDALPQADSSYPFHLYVNGVLRDLPSAISVLAHISADDIQEMRYIDCLDKGSPKYRNSLMVTLKPGKSG